MSRLAELAAYKTIVAERLIDNSNICKALFYSDGDYLDQPDVTNPEQLLHDCIYLYPYKPDESGIENGARTWITVSLNDFNGVGSSVMRAGFLVIEVLAHKELLRTDYELLRTDDIAAEIDGMLSGGRSIGIGRLQFAGMNEISLNANHYGVVLKYRPVDFG
ncbi:hypothetical protein [Cohnella cellulosilytica]|uniref:Uncharacterized protein n=1 Tax=Cohnella cellulosilytica TaxID=986710 RepID=A0ABW2FFF0_9BACL